MGIEIERKYLIKKDLWATIEKGKGIYYKQGYLLTDPNKTIRVRISDTNAFLTIKGSSKGASRPEFEYEIPLKDAQELLDSFSISSISKIRYEVEYAGKIWEVDEFLEDNQGLIVAEIELESETERFKVPEWIGKEVTEDIKYYNSNLSLKPFNTWKNGE